ncbi:MAG TPA: DUF4350 domain-containing protein [Oculatellaceae cyanobacterium]|jgi:hypothetical protein
MKKRWLWISAIALIAIILLTLFTAPNTSKVNSGSTYSRFPDGYGAWYAFMEKQGTPVKRWQKPFADLAGVATDEVPSLIKYSESQIANSITLLRVYSQLNEDSLDSQQQKWVEKGNTLVILGVKKPVTEARFITFQQSTVGSVKIDTRRRLPKLEQGEQQLGDRFGSIVWQQKLDKGQVIYATTPYLAANAYQEQPGNYQLLAKLVTQSGNRILVDEYIHGYKDPEVITKEDGADLISYLSKTPLFAALVQVSIIILVLVWANNKRLGSSIALKAPVVDNSEAYIQALASVLQKAESSEFVLEAVGKQEQLQLQKALGLGSTLVDHQILVSAWVQQTGKPATELQQALKVQSMKRRIKEKQLLDWLEKWQKIRSIQ